MTVVVIDVARNLLGDLLGVAVAPVFIEGFIQSND